MGQLPITSRLKRTAFQLRSAAKQTTPDASTVKKGKNTTEIITVPGTSGTDNYDAAVAAEGTKQVDPKKITPEMTARANKKRADAKAADVAAAKPIEKEIVVKGDDVIAPTYSKREGTVQTNFDGRQIGRATKFKNRYVRQSQGKLDRGNDRMAKFQKDYMVAGVDADGNPTSTFKAPEAGEKGFKKYARLSRKITENTNELADFKAGAANQAEAVRSGKSIGSTTRRDEDRRDTAGDQTKDERIAQVAAEQGITTANPTQAEGAIEAAGEAGSADPSTDKGMFDVDTTNSFDPTKFGEYTAPTKKKGYGMTGKSPATKKLQGAQGKLPGHLQAAIKATPERTALKKGYFKNK
tara:strand:- start:420 stop:1478 length:1059 start_codon:yes stop_codon:yes gene_type:complete